MIYIRKRLGRYNLCSTEKEWLVSIQFPSGSLFQRIRETWAEEDEPDIDGLPPSEVIELISERVESHLISSSRKEERKIIGWVRENAERLDAQWAQDEIAQKRKCIERLHSEIKSLECLEIK